MVHRLSEQGTRGGTVPAAPSSPAGAGLTRPAAGQLQQLPLQPLHAPQQGPSSQPQEQVHFGSAQQQAVSGAFGVGIGSSRKR